MRSIRKLEGLVRQEFETINERFLGGGDVRKSIGEYIVDMRAVMDMLEKENALDAYVAVSEYCEMAELISVSLDAFELPRLPKLRKAISDAVLEVVGGDETVLLQENEQTELANEYRNKGYISRSKQLANAKVVATAPQREQDPERANLLLIVIESGYTIASVRAVGVQVPKSALIRGALGF